MSADADQARTEGQRAERDRIVAYLSHHRANAEAAAAAATTDESRTYQATIAKAMSAMVEAISGDFHWKARL